MSKQHRVGGSVFLMAALFAALAPGAARAQPASIRPAVAGFLTINGGLAQPALTTFKNVATATDGFNTDELRADYAVKRGPAIDVGGGVVLRDRIVLGLSFSRYADRQPASATLNLTHPFFHPTISAAAKTEGLDRTETGLHVQLGYKIPTRSAFEVTVFGGPSRVALTQGLIADLDVSETFSAATRTWSAVINEFETEKVRGSAWGYNVGTDVGYRISRNVSVGALVRYTRASISVEDPILTMVRDRSSTRDLTVGGLQTMGGVRLRF